MLILLSNIALAGVSIDLAGTDGTSPQSTTEPEGWPSDQDTITFTADDGSNCTVTSDGTDITFEEGTCPAAFRLKKEPGSLTSTTPPLEYELILPTKEDEEQDQGNQQVTYKAPAGFKAACLEEDPKEGKQQELCIDASSGSILILHTPDLVQNDHLQIRIAHPPTSGISATVDKASGITKSTVLDQVPTVTSQRDAPPEDARVSVLDLGSRPAGENTVKVKVGSEEVEIKINVEATHSGSLSLGLAGIYGGAADAGYSAYKPLNAATAEIVASSASNYDLEFTIGYWHWLNGPSHRFGKPYRASDTSLRWGPYLGLGLVEADSLTITPLKSGYLGWGVGNQDFSVTFAGVLRKTDRLAGGLEVGDAVTGDSDIALNSAYRPGAAVIVSIHPDLAKWVRGSGSGGDPAPAQQEVAPEGGDDGQPAEEPEQQDGSGDSEQDAGGDA